MINRALPTEQQTPLLPFVVGVAAAVVLALAVLAVVAVMMYWSEDIMLAAPSILAGGDHLPLLHELSALVAPLKDGALPAPSL